MPKSYGEAKTFFNQEAHIYYILGLLLARKGEAAQERAAYEQAAVYKAAVSEISLFRALALEKLARRDEAEAVLNEMLRTDRPEGYALVLRCRLAQSHAV